MLFVFKNHSCSKPIRVQNSFVFKKTFVFEIQKSSRHAAHHAEAAGDGREHGNDEIDDSFQGFLFHGFKILIVNVNVLVLFLFLFLF